MIVIHDAGKIAARENHVILAAKKPITAPQRLIIVNHGVGQRAFDSVFAGARYLRLWRTLVDAGFVLLHFDGVPVAHWGNDQSIARLTTGWTWAKANLAAAGLPIKTDKVSLLGFSHGNTLSYAWARQNVGQVQCIASVIGVVNTQDIHDNDRGALRTGIQGAFNPVAIGDLVTTINSVNISSPANAQFTAADVGRIIEGPGLAPGTTISTVTSLTAATIAVNATATGAGVAATLWRSGVAPADAVYATHSPTRFPADVATIPQRHWVSDDDTVAIGSETASFAAAVGAQASVVSFGAYGHSVGPQPLGALPLSDIAAWFTARG